MFIYLKGSLKSTGQRYPRSYASEHVIRAISDVWATFLVQISGQDRRGKRDGILHINLHISEYFS